ncbi:MAG: hypothetical protein U0175_28745 [Caldilineaceae bacterium]
MPQTTELSLPFYEQIIDFLAASPSAQEIIAYRPPQYTQARFSQLLEKSKEGLLSLEENDELDHYIRIDRMMSLIKAKAYRRLSRQAA